MPPLTDHDDLASIRDRDDVDPVVRVYHVEAAFPIGSRGKGPFGLYLENPVVAVDLRMNEFPVFEHSLKKRLT